MPFTIFYRRIFVLVFFSALFLFFTPSIKAQISANLTSGCAPFYVQFQGIPGSTSILWDFKDGTKAYNLNPRHTFSTPGTYTVTYTAILNENPINQSISIKVLNVPSPSFVASAQRGCKPLTVTFNDKSTGGEGSSIVNWEWNFGDGGTNFNKTSKPAHTYTAAGLFGVTVKVTDANGCTASLRTPNMIATSDPPQAVITSNPNSLDTCFGPLSVLLSGTSSVSKSTTGSTALSYSWDFANSTYTKDPTYSAVASPPVLAYSDEGSYTITLIVTDNNNCSAKATKKLTITSPFASFSVNDTVCKGVAFQVQNPKKNSLYWDYGDGKKGTSNSHTYLASGTYNVKLTASSGKCSIDSIKTIFVEEIIADFSSSPSFFCNLPGTVLLKDLSTNASSYSWAFSKGSDQAAIQYAISPSSSTLQNPAVTISNLDTNPYTIDKAARILNATLSVTSPHGCISTKSKTLLDTVSLSTARFIPNITRGCAPLKVDFSNSSLSKETIVNWRYEFGDGTFASLNSIGDTNHVYTTPGTYKPVLIIENNFGCKDTSYPVPIYVGGAPVVDFSVDKTNICIGEPVQFTSLISSSDSVDTWHYSTDGGIFMSSCTNDPNPQWAYKNSTGSQDATLTACWHGCCSSLTKSGLVNVKGPLANVSVRMNCDTPFTYIFTANVQGADKWVINFGDNDSIESTSQTIFSHTYSARGDYNAILTAYNSGTGCSPFKDTVRIKVRDIKARITSDTTLCPNSTLSYNATTSQDVEPTCNGGYIWLFHNGAGPTITNNPKTSNFYKDAGIYNTTLVVSDVNGCRDTATQIIRVYEVTPLFTPSRLYFCIEDSVQFINQTSTDIAVSNYIWDFGDGTKDTTTASQPNTAHIYEKTAALSYTVKLTVNAAHGCSESYSKKIFVSRPSAMFKPTTDTTICSGDSVKFQPNFTKHQSYLWTFDDGADSSRYTSPYHTYTGAGSYTTILSITDSIGCYGTDTITSCVKVQDYPKAGYISSADSSQKLCYPFISFFSDTSIADVFDSRSWNFGNGIQGDTDKVVNTVYQLPGDYIASLIVKTTYGCSDTLNKPIKVEGPLADFTVSDSVICKGDTITLSIKDTVDFFTYHWDFGDGYDTTAVSPIMHSYNIHPPEGIANVKLTFWGTDSTCIQVRSKPIAVREVIADFDRNNEYTPQDTAHCIGIADMFVDYAVGADEWNWDFGDGTSSSTSGFQNHEYAAAGKYTVSLAIANTQYGCVDTLYRSMIIFPIPVTTATGGDTCIGQSLQLHATGGSIYQWAPNEGLDNDTLPDPMATPTVSTTYTVVVTDSNSCSQNDSAFVYIEQRPPQFIWDTTIITGTSVQLNAFAPNSPKYLWTPTDSLSCTDCYNPIANPKVDAKYTVTISDTSGCFAIESFFNLRVLPLPKIDVPTAFTPNGDGKNDVLYVGAWGIKNLIEFKIYNRWGKIVFETNDPKQGWDGTFNGEPQNIETYLWEVKAESYIDTDVIVKKGYLKLFR